MFETAHYFANLDPYQLAGLAGFTVYLASYCALQFQYLNSNSAVYSVSCIIAASLVAISLIAEFNLASALIQGSWIVIGIAGLALRMRTPKRANRQPTFDAGVKP